MKNKTREQLVQMYLDSLKENVIPWHQTWSNANNKNGITNQDYRGVNQLLLSFVSEKEKYKDPRWFTFVQIKEKGYKLKNGAKGVPIEFISFYNHKTKDRLDLIDYNNLVKESPDSVKDYKMFVNNYHVFNADLIEGVPSLKEEKNKIVVSSFVDNAIKSLNVKYNERGDKAYYSPSSDEIVLPKKDKFKDNYSYYATQLHELCHSTSHESRLNRVVNINDINEYAKEELVAEISSSFLMKNIGLNVKAEHYDNHKAYIQSWISILEDKPSELFKAINESNKVVDYIEEKVKEMNMEMIR